MLLGRELLCGCDELWVFGERISEGMEVEIAGKIPLISRFTISKSG